MRRLAFLDLDLTLFDYTAAREGATRAALQAMSIDGNSTTAINLMNSLLIPYGDLLVDVGLPNLRRQWKAPELFTIFIALSEGGGSKGNIRVLKNLLAEIRTKRSLVPGISPTFRRRLENLNLLRRAANDTQMDVFVHDIRSIVRRDETRSKINLATTAFNRYLKREVIASEGVPELLENLKARGFEIYIVSEGDEQVQNEKISILGLADNTDGTYVSSSCCQSERLLGWLWQQAKHASESNGSMRAIEVLYDEALQYSHKTASLFRKVMHTVLLPHSSRRQFYLKPAWLSEPECIKQGSIHVLLFGDRYEKDLYPAIEAFNKVTAIRLLSGKYGRTYQSHFVRTANLPAPDATVKSVSKAAAYIKTLALPAEIPPGNVIVHTADSRRVQAVEHALDVMRSSIEKVPLWILEQIEDLTVALRGSETKTDE
jgi:phosphoglycolate phosphatase-like HAD superfamily hydrolase